MTIIKKYGISGPKGKSQYFLKLHFDVSGYTWEYVKKENADKYEMESAQSICDKIGFPYNKIKLLETVEIQDQEEYNLTCWQSQKKEQYFRDQEEMEFYKKSRYD